MTPELRQYQDIYIKHFKYLYNNALYVMQDQQLAEDIVQETFCAAMEKGILTHPNPTAWLLSVSKHIAYNTAKKRSYEYIGTETEPAAEDKALDELETDLLLKTVLPEIDYDIFKMYLDGIPEQDIADKHDLTLTALSTRIYRIKKTLKKLYTFAFIVLFWNGGVK